MFGLSQHSFNATINNQTFYGHKLFTTLPFTCRWEYFLCHAMLAHEMVNNCVFYMCNTSNTIYLLYRQISKQILEARYEKISYLARARKLMQYK